MPLTITIPDQELFNEETSEFFIIKGRTLKLEHSLVSISKWESKWNKAFLKKDEEKTDDQIIDYVRCMTLTKDVDPDLYNYIPQSVMQEISKYIDAPMTATWFNNEEQKGGVKGNKETVTSELIYYWMIALNIPFECQRWHLNRLLTLVQVCNIKNTPPKKMSKREIFNRNRALNEARKKSMHTNG